MQQPLTFTTTNLLGDLPQGKITLRYLAVSPRDDITSNTDRLGLSSSLQNHLEVLVAIYPRGDIRLKVILLRGKITKAKLLEPRPILSVAKSLEVSRQYRLVERSPQGEIVLNADHLGLSSSLRNHLKALVAIYPRGDIARGKIT